MRNCTCVCVSEHLHQICGYFPKHAEWYVDCWRFELPPGNIVIFLQEQGEEHQVNRLFDLFEALPLPARFPAVKGGQVLQMLVQREV